MTFGYAAIVFVVLFVVLFAIGPGSIPWFLMSELFLPNAKQQAIGIAVAVNWLSNYVVSVSFLPLQVRHTYRQAWESFFENVTVVISEKNGFHWIYSTWFNAKYSRFLALE